MSAQIQTSRADAPQHHLVPRSRSTALLIVDMINDFRLAESDGLFKQTLPAARAIAKLKARLTKAGHPSVYVNDNFKKWHDSFATTVEHISKRSEKGRRIAEILMPSDKDYYVLKPQRSGFFETPLEVLLRELKIRSVIITGVATDICVLATAIDAEMRGLEVHVPRDCTASMTPQRRRAALRLLEQTINADTTPSTLLRIPRK